MNWRSDSGDPSIRLFTAFKQRVGLACAPNAHVAELGCAETTFLEELHRQNPAMQLDGVDWRTEPQRETNGWIYRQGDACDPGIFACASLDAVIMLGALEHFGLGYYGDPCYTAGDILTMENVAGWLKPGGWCYFDVPANPRYKVTENHHFRIYSPRAVTERLSWSPRLVECARTYSLHDPSDVFVDAPEPERVPYYYCAVKMEQRCP